jgi:NhaP-type Na+/H+ or K+/H+ antiporter
VRFALTAEAGLNDGAAFPFVYLAIAVALAEATFEPYLGDWLLVAVIWKVVVGVLIGWVGGWVMGNLAFRLPNRAALSKTNDGFAALGITFLAYGTTELVNGYGFLAVFIAAVAFRAVERRHEYHRNLHSFSEQIERLVMMVLLVCFGAAIADGTIFSALSWRVVLVALLILFVLRPLSGWISLLGHPSPYHERLAISFFGIRGLGSFYYVAYALGQANFVEPQLIWVVVCCVVLLSIITHGIAVTPVMRRLDRFRRVKSVAKIDSAT